MSFTISDLKRAMGSSLGLRSNKYLIEIPVPGADGEKICILCRSTSLPERNIGTVDVYSKGRKYKMRGETEFPGTYNISILDDSSMSIRRLFDAWLTLVDNTETKDDGITGILGNQARGVISAISGFITAANTLKNAFQQDSGLSFLLNGLKGVSSAPLYQTEINIWQLDGNNNKVYGYQLQNAYPVGLGAVELDDGQENILSEFSVDFAYSEFIPLEPSKTSRLTDALLGKDLRDIRNGIKNLF